MKIIKYKKTSNRKYKVFLENGESITLHEDIILKHNLLITKQIDDIEEIKKYNDEYLIYDNTLKYLSTKMRCELEIRNYLKKTLTNENKIDEIVNKLKESSLLNDRLYVKSYILDKTNLNKYGPNKLKNELLRLNIDKDIIDEEISKLDSNTINDNLKELIDKKIRLNRKYAGDVLKNKILIELVNMGYSKEAISKILSEKDLSNNELYDKEYQKLYNKYKNKYSGSELEYFIKQKLYSKGLKKMQ